MRGRRSRQKISKDEGVLRNGRICVFTSRKVGSGFFTSKSLFDSKCLIELERERERVGGGG